MVHHLPVIADKPIIEIQPPKRVGSKQGYGNGQCVALLQAYGFNIHVGAARNWPSAAIELGYKVDDIPLVGSAMISKESSRGTNSGHAMLVIEVQDEYVMVKEQNYRGLYVVSTRKINRSSEIYKESKFIHKS